MPVREKMCQCVVLWSSCEGAVWEVLTSIPSMLILVFVVGLDDSRVRRLQVFASRGLDMDERLAGGVNAAATRAVVEGRLAVGVAVHVDCRETVFDGLFGMERRFWWKVGWNERCSEDGNQGDDLYLYHNQ